MASVSGKRGSSVLGWMMLISVFGPMLALAILWGIAAASGAGGNGNPTGASPFRDAIMNLMVWVLMISGIAVAIEGLVILFFRFTGRMFRN
ncbi:MAG: hypothetical protein K1X35_08740 [Caulobacteraceae bacterium]|nr:hypothetical protein [Caulobacteraceae bacterium]